MANDNRKVDDFFKKNQDEPEELIEYIKDINQGVDPNKQTFFDKMAIFFRNTAERAGLYYKRKKREDISERPSTFRRKLRIFALKIWRRIKNSFNFEAGVDILDDTSVLYRRNKVNKNILFITNIVFILFTMIGTQNPNYVIIIGFTIVMFLINHLLKRIINEEPRTLIKQQMAMYVGSVYILIASLAVYTKLVWSARKFDAGALVVTVSHFNNLVDNSIAQAGYILIYFALVVIALYQDPTLLRILFYWVLGFMTIIHIFVMYPIYEHAGSIEQLYHYLFTEQNNVLIDIVLRTMLLIIFNVALYSSVSIGEMMTSKRKEELIKRRDMERDFKAVVGDVFDVIGVFNSNTINQNQVEAYRVAELASRLANVLGLSSRVCTEIYDYTVIHADKVNELNILEYEGKETLDENDYDVIREKTILGSVIIKRLQLNQKSEDIVRAHFEKTNDQTFIQRVKRIQRSQEGQIILLAEMYDILRQPRNYKTEQTHRKSIEMLQIDFKEYFEPNILDRFLKYQMEFSEYYDKYKFSDRS